MICFLPLSLLLVGQPLHSLGFAAHSQVNAATAGMLLHAPQTEHVFDTGAVFLAALHAQAVQLVELSDACEGRQVGWQLRDLVGKNSGFESIFVLGTKGRLPRNHLVQDAPQTPDIGLLVVRLAF